MYLLYVGVTHRVAPLSVLERVHFSDEEKIAALKKLKAEKSILEDVILSTGQSCTWLLISYILVAIIPNTF